MVLYILIFLSVNKGECFWCVIITHGFWNVSNLYSTLMSAALFVDTWAICTLRSFRKVLTFIQEWVEKTCMLYTFNLVFSFLLSVKICLSFFVQQFPTFLPKDLSCRALSSSLKKNKRLAWVLRSLSEVIWAAWVALGEVMVVTVMSPVRSQCTEDSTESSHSSFYLFSALFRWEVFRWNTDFRLQTSCYH